MGEVPLYWDLDFSRTQQMAAREACYRGTFLTRKRTPLGP